jgi:hypothetical protein
MVVDMVVGKLELVVDMVVGKLELVVGMVVDKLELVVDKLGQLVLGIVVDRIRTFLVFFFGVLKFKNLKKKQKDIKYIKLNYI